MASPVESDRLHEVASAVEQFGRSRFPDAYTGVALEPDQCGLVVYRRPSASFDTELHHLVPGAPVTVRDARYTEGQLLDVVARLTADDGYWRERGVRIATFGPRADGSGIDLATPDVELARRLLPDRYDIEFLIVAGGPVTPYQPGPTSPGR